MIMNCQRHDWILLLAKHLIAVPCLTCYATELDFFTQYLTFCSRLFWTFNYALKKGGMYSVLNQMFRLFKLTGSKHNRCPIMPCVLVCWCCDT